jgi:hypothetical protein
MALSETMNPASAVARNGVRDTLRFEGVALAAIALAIYAHAHGSTQTFAIWFLAPDLSMLFYAFGARAGAVAYNAAHSTIGPLALFAFGFATGQTALIAAACIWLAHVGFDRALGYGLKYSSSFRDTHLGRIGKRD